MGDKPGGLGDLLLIQFARSPQPGEVKTRMQPELSAEQACDLHLELLEWTNRTLCEADMAEVELWVSGDPENPLLNCIQGFGVNGIVSQSGGDLGERMCAALRSGLDRFPMVILVGSDCPSIDTAYLRSAREALLSNSIVLGPADDGGYVLIGARQLVPEMFSGISWGQASVFDETVEVLKRLGVVWSVLGSLPDVDRPEDLPHWQALKKRGATVL